MTVPLTPLRQVFEELKMAEAVWQWNERTKQVVALAYGEKAVTEFEACDGYNKGAAPNAFPQRNVLLGNAQRSPRLAESADQRTALIHFEPLPQRYGRLRPVPCVSRTSVRSFQPAPQPHDPVDRQCHTPTA